MGGDAVLVFEGNDFRVFPNYPWRWIDTWRYSLIDSAADDQEILQAMLSDEHYAFSFLAPYPSPTLQGRLVRGPYYLDGLTPGSFFPITSEEAWDQLDQFLGEFDPPVGRSELDLDGLIGGSLDKADKIFQMQEDSTIRHIVAWILGDWGEFVAIDRDARVVIDVARGTD